MIKHNNILIRSKKAKIRRQYILDFSSKTLEEPFEVINFFN